MRVANPKEYINYKQFLSLFVSTNIKEDFTNFQEKATYHDEYDLTGREGLKNFRRAIKLESQKEALPFFSEAILTQILNMTLMNVNDKKMKNVISTQYEHVDIMHFNDGMFTIQEAVKRGYTKELFLLGISKMFPKMQQALYHDAYYLSVLLSSDIEFEEAKIRLIENEEFLGFVRLITQECPQLMSEDLFRKRINDILLRNQDSLFHEITKQNSNVSRKLKWYGLEDRRHLI